MDEHHRSAHVTDETAARRRRRASRAVTVAVAAGLALGAGVAAAPVSVAGGRPVATTAPAAYAETSTVAQAARAQVRPRAALTLPRGVAVGARGTVSVRVTPAVRGRVVTLQRQSTDAWGDPVWKNVAKAKQDRRGVATFRVVRPAVVTTYRAVVAPLGKSKGFAGSSVRWFTPGMVAPVPVAVSPRDEIYGSYPARNDEVAYSRDARGRLVVAARAEDGKSLVVDVLDPLSGRAAARRITLSLAGWTEWGGVHTTPDGEHWVLLGRLNEQEDDDREVIAVRRYDAEWRLLGTAYVKGGASQMFKGIETPFRSGAAHVLREGNTLVVHMSRRMYKSDDGLRHQSNFTFEVDVPTMRTRTFDEIGGSRFGASPYASHSFNTYVARHGDDLVFIDHGDAYPRAVQMAVMRGYPTSRQVTEHQLMTFAGGFGVNATGAAITGVLDGPSGVLVSGNSVRQQNPWNPDEKRNAFVIAADPATGAFRTTWLTSFAAGGLDTVGEPRMVEVADDRFAVLFDVERRGLHRLEYRLVDSTGTVHASASHVGVRFAAGSEPLLVGSRLLWLYGGDHSDEVHLYALDVSDPTRPKVAR